MPQSLPSGACLTAPQKLRPPRGPTPLMAVLGGFTACVVFPCLGTGRPCRVLAELRVAPTSFSPSGPSASVTVRAPLLKNRRPWEHGVVRIPPWGPSPSESRGWSRSHASACWSLNLSSHWTPSWAPHLRSAPQFQWDIKSQMHHGSHPPQSVCSQQKSPCSPSNLLLLFRPLSRSWGSTFLPGIEAGNAGGGPTLSSFRGLNPASLSVLTHELWACSGHLSPAFGQEGTSGSSRSCALA